MENVGPDFVRNVVNARNPVDSSIFHWFYSITGALMHVTEYSEIHII